LSVLRSFGFHPIFYGWVEEILSSARLSILVNGKAVGFFCCLRGVRQGDPLSPLLFYIAEEVLSRAITLACDTGKLRPMSYCRGVQLPTHVLYADDAMIFCKATKSNICCILHIFQLYEDTSGQMINRSKSKFYAGNVFTSRLGPISAPLDFSRGTIPFTYLGCPIFQGKPKASYFRQIADKIRVKLSTWKELLLSIMGRVQLVNSVIMVCWFILFAYIYGRLPC
jgi:hypothetical protein